MLLHIIFWSIVFGGGVSYALFLLRGETMIPLLPYFALATGALIGLTLARRPIPTLVGMIFGGGSGLLGWLIFQTFFLEQNSANLKILG